MTSFAFATHKGLLILRPGSTWSVETHLEGLPQALGTVASRLAADPEKAGVFYAANNHGLFRSEDAVRSWKAPAVEWPEGAFERGVAAMTVFSE
jgi:hypothetical protein